VRGDPGSALLEVLDPEQNDSFVDHYLNVPFDLSKVLFIATANRLDTIPGPLLDRMEVIELPGYTSAEKHEIAMSHLIPKQIERHGITGEHIEFTPAAVDLVIGSYTREAGVRSLDRQLAAICRNVAVKVAESRDRAFAAGEVELDDNAVVAPVVDHDHHLEEDAGLGSSIPPPPLDETEGAAIASAEEVEAASALEPPLVLDANFSRQVVTPELVSEILGPARFESEIAQRTAVPGVATGMAWTQVGGEILFIEAWLHRGSGRVQLTGQLGSVMQESVRAALSFIRGNLSALQLDRLGDLADVDLQEALSKADLHVHFPAGAVPKDGPSAGVAVTAAILSALSGRCVRADTACTGEITLRGLVLPVGGIKEKVLAAHRAGIARILLPKRNEKDVAEIPDSVRAELEVVFVSDIVEAMAQLFDTHTKVTSVPWLREIEESERQERRRGRALSGKVNPMEPDDMGPGAEGSHTGHSFGAARDLCGPADFISLL